MVLEELQFCQVLLLPASYGKFSGKIFLHGKFSGKLGQVRVSYGKLGQVFFQMGKSWRVLK